MGQGAAEPEAGGEQAADPTQPAQAAGQGGAHPQAAQGRGWGQGTVLYISYL